MNSKEKEEMSLFEKISLGIGEENAEILFEEFAGKFVHIPKLITVCSNSILHDFRDEDLSLKDICDKYDEIPESEIISLIDQYKFVEGCI